MKRTIAIMLAVLTMLTCMAGCSRRTGNVADNNDGMLTEQEDQNANASGSTTQSADQNARSGDFMDDMKDAARDAGDAMGDIGRAVGDAGKAVGDAITGQDDTSGTGMTGSR